MCWLWPRIATRTMSSQPIVQSLDSSSLISLLFFWWWFTNCVRFSRQQDTLFCPILFLLSNVCNLKRLHHLLSLALSCSLSHSLTCSKPSLCPWSPVFKDHVLQTSLVVPPFLVSILLISTFIILLAFFSGTQTDKLCKTCLYCFIFGDDSFSHL